jgi:CubicO group peptidase (beta-lactamase class C family)
VSSTSLLREWPAGSSLVVRRLSPASSHDIAVIGDVEAVRPWASVTKVAVAFAAARAVSSGAAAYEDPVGPAGSTLAHLLAHASGLGLEAGDPSMAVGARRIYSNAGIDLAAEHLAGEPGAAGWLSRNVSEELGLDVTFAGRPAAGAQGSVLDIASVAEALAVGRGIEDSVRKTALSPYLPDITGVVPGFGRFDPCWWGLGVELHGNKNHWMGTVASPTAYGHFGQSGALVLVDPDTRLLVAAAAGEPFGEWARATWPTWINDVLRWAAAQ